VTEFDCPLTENAAVGRAGAGLLGEGDGIGAGLGADAVVMVSDWVVVLRFKRLAVIVALPLALPRK
jgi:hypothetical protein